MVAFPTFIPLITQLSLIFKQITVLPCQIIRVITCISKLYKDTYVCPYACDLNSYSHSVQLFLRPSRQHQIIGTSSHHLYFFFPYILNIHTCSTLIQFIFFIILYYHYIIIFFHYYYIIQNPFWSLYAEVTLINSR